MKLHYERELSWILGLLCWLCGKSYGYPPPPVFYHTHANMTITLQQLTASNPHISSLFSVGKSSNGRELWVVELSTDNEVVGKPYVKLVGNIHGNEPPGRELLIHLAKYFIDGYNDGVPRIVQILNRTNIHLMPSMNPDGFKKSFEGNCKTGPGRENGHGIDLNRNFPDGHSDYDKRRREEPEVTAVIGWSKSKPFILSASLHSGAMVAGYPFDKYPGGNKDWAMGAKSPTDDDDIVRHLALTYSQAHPVMYHGISCHAPHITIFPQGITNGAAWYPVTGGMQDYNYLYHGCMELTLEISCCKYPPGEELPNLWQENLESLLFFIEESHRGVKGIVTDGETNQPIEGATVTVHGRSMETRTTANGEYWRLLLPGLYFLQVSALGYEDQTQRIVILKERYGEKPSALVVNIPIFKIGSRNITTNNTISTLINELSSPLPLAESSLNNQQTNVLQLSSASSQINFFWHPYIFYFLTASIISY